MKTKDEWIDDMELRLKRALLDVMDLPEDEGRSYLQQELRSHLEDVNGESNRLDYLKSLGALPADEHCGSSDGHRSSHLFRIG